MALLDAMTAVAPEPDRGRRDVRSRERRALGSGLGARPRRSGAAWAARGDRTHAVRRRSVEWPRSDVARGAPAVPPQRRGGVRRARRDRAYARRSGGDRPAARDARQRARAGWPALPRPGRSPDPSCDVDRASLERYAAARGITWVDDPSNARLDFLRNRVRHELLPALRRADPTIDDGDSGDRRARRSLASRSRSTRRRRGAPSALRRAHACRCRVGTCGL